MSTGDGKVRAFANSEPNSAPRGAISEITASGRVYHRYELRSKAKARRQHSAPAKGIAKYSKMHNETRGSATLLLPNKQMVCMQQTVQVVYMCLLLFRNHCTAKSVKLVHSRFE